MLLPVPVLLMDITGEEVKNLHTPTIVALIVTVVLSAACTEGAARRASESQTRRERPRIESFIVLFPFERVDRPART